MGGMDDQDAMIQGIPRRSPSPAKDPVLPELTDAAAQQLVQKGAKMYAWMSEPSTERLTQVLRQDNKLGPDDPLQSRFVNYPEDLTTSGWEKDAMSDERYSDWRASVPLMSMVAGLGLSSTWDKPPNQPGDNQFVTWHHANQDFDGKDHRIPTNAFYSNVYNSKDGVIMFVSNYGPRQELPMEARGNRDAGCTEEDVNEFIEKYEYPKLSHVSDVTALEYVNQCSKRDHSAKALSKLVMFGSQSDGTVQVVDHLLKKKGIAPMAKSRETGRYKAPEWAGKITYQAGSDGFNLLLATPNGNMATFLLIQHRQEFGLKRVSKIDIFDDEHYADFPEDGYKGASMVYYLEDLDTRGKPVAKAGVSSGESGKKPPKPGSSGRKPGRVVKSKSGGGRQGLRSGSNRQRAAKL